MTDIQVKCFLALAEHLNFTQAARDLCISQSTLSMHISALEKNLALTLFIRTKRKVELSPEGEILYPVLKNVNEALEAAVTEARNLHKSHANILRIGYVNGMSTDKILVPILSDYRKKHSDIKVELMRGNNNWLIEALLSHKLDVVFSHEQSLLMNPGLTGTLVFESPLCIVCAQGRFETDADISALIKNALQKETFFMLSKDTNTIDKMYLRMFCEKYGIEMPEIKEVNSVEAQIFNVEMGNGICLADYASSICEDIRFDFRPVSGITSRCSAISRRNNPNPMVKEFMSFNAERQKEIKEDI